MRRLFALILTSLSFVSATLYGQGIITGVVTDSFTGEPLPNATVYVNGTTNGTTTAEDGRFELKGVSYPATVVFSFVGYEPQAHDYYRNPGELSIKLKTSELPEIEVSGKIAKKDLTYFKRMFLGVTKVKGFSRPVQFYSPQYPDGPIPGEIDSRRTLYWNPNVVTDYDGNARVEFYNNSFTKRFTISGAGITTSGEPYVLRQNW